MPLPIVRSGGWRKIRCTPRFVTFTAVSPSSVPPVGFVVVEIDGEAAVEPERPGDADVVHSDPLAGVGEVLGDRVDVAARSRLPHVAVERFLGVRAGRMSTGNTRMPARA